LSRRAEHLDGVSLAEGLAKIPMSRLCRLAFIEMLQADNGVEAESQSWLANLAMVKGGGLRRFWNDTETHRCAGGAQTLPLRFRSELKTVHLNTVVTRLDIDVAGVKLTRDRERPLNFDESSSRSRQRCGGVPSRLFRSFQRNIKCRSAAM
jgi:hypothetical protein